MPGQATPAGDVAVVPGHGMDRSPLADRKIPTYAIDQSSPLKMTRSSAAVAVQVADEELVVPGEAAPARDVAVVAGRELESGAVAAQQPT